MSDEEDPMQWLASHGMWAGRTSYDGAAKRYIGTSGHYLDDTPPGALFAVGVKRLEPGLLGPAPQQLGWCGMAVVGRPVARQLPQDGSVGEILRMVLADGLPHGTASRILQVVARIATRLGLKSLIAYHDRTRHTGCIYKKAGFRRDGVTKPRNENAKAWATRPGREQSAKAGRTPKRRWRLDLKEAA